MLAPFVVIGVPFVVAIHYSLMRGRGLAWAFLLFPTLAGAFALVAGGAAASLRGGRRSHAVVVGTATGGLGIASLGLVVGGQLLTFGLTDPRALDAGNVRVPSYLDLIALTVVAGSLRCVLAPSAPSSFIDTGTTGPRNHDGFPPGWLPYRLSFPGFETRFRTSLQYGVWPKATPS